MDRLGTPAWLLIASVLRHHRGSDKNAEQREAIAGLCRQGWSACLLDIKLVSEAPESAASVLLVATGPDEDADAEPMLSEITGAVIDRWCVCFRPLELGAACTAHGLHLEY